METVWIVVAIAVAVVLIFLLLSIGSEGIEKVTAWVSFKFGNNKEAKGSAKFSRPKPEKPRSRTTASHNIMIGDEQSMNVSGNAEANNNLMEGKRQQFNVNEFSNKSRRDEGDDKA